MSVVFTVPQVFFQLPHMCLIYPGYSEQCEQKDRRFLKKLKIKLPYDPAIPLLDICLGKTIIQKDTCTPIFIAGLLPMTKTWKQCK